MKQLKQYTAAGIFFVLIAGTLLHFLYDWTNNNRIAGLFAPVNESVWEHMKLLFFPMLIYSLVMAHHLKTSCPYVSSALCFGMLAGTLGIPLLYYAYTSVLGRNIFFLDLAIFVLCTIIAFFLAYSFTLSCRVQPYAPFLYCLVCVLLLCFIVFSYHPPDLFLFSKP